MNGKNPWRGPSRSPYDERCVYRSPSRALPTSLKGALPSHPVFILVLFSSSAKSLSEGDTGAIHSPSAVGEVPSPPDESVHRDRSPGPSVSLRGDAAAQSRIILDPAGHP